jgi:L-lactate utilization protein LutB
VPILSDSREWYKSLKVENTLNALKRNGFDAHFAQTREEATSLILEMVPRDALVGLGGSVTLREMGIPKLLTERGNTVADHWVARQRGASSMEVLKIRKQHINSDVFISSTNALTENGELVNIDGGGQRVAAMIFGPRKVIIVAGFNKITRNLEEGLWRTRNVASPMNAKRLNLRTPCATSGVCSDCTSDDRICNATTIIQRRPRNVDATVIVVGERLGY